MFFGRKVNPYDQERIKTVLQMWNSHVRTVDSATSLMREAAAQHPEGIASPQFESYRQAAAETVSKLLEEVDDDSRWPALGDEKGYARMWLVRSQLSQVHIQQLDSLRLQKEFVESQKSGWVSQEQANLLGSLHQDMGKNLDQLGKSVSQLAKHYKLKINQFLT